MSVRSAYRRKNVIDRFVGSTQLQKKAARETTKRANATANHGCPVESGIMITAVRRASRKLAEPK